MDTPPLPVAQPKPRYPEHARQNAIHGTVVVVLLVSALGQVAHAEIRESIPALDGAALAAARLWSFEPASLGGQPVPSVVFAPVTFELRNP
jgi:protein TonB